MYLYVFIDWENIEQTAKDKHGSVLNYDVFKTAITDVAAQKSLNLVDIRAYGDFDKGVPGLLTRLELLGIKPIHVVTKTAHEYIKGSTDIVLSLDILETMYSNPHITDYLFISGDNDLRHVINKLKIKGKTIHIMGFQSYTSQYLIDMSSEFIPLDNYPGILRKVTKSEIEQLAHKLMSNEAARTIIESLGRDEATMPFVGLNNFRTKLVEKYPSRSTEFSDALTDCLDSGAILTNEVPNPKNPRHPTRACRLNQENQAVKHFLNL